LFAVLSLKTYADDSSLEVSMFDDGDFTVVFDNTQYNYPGNAARFDNIPAGEHYLKIMKVSAKVPMKDDVVFEGKIKIPAGFNVYAVIDEYNSFAIYKKVAIDKGRCDCNCSYRRYCSTDGKIEEHHDEHQVDLSNDCKYRAINDEDFKKFKKSIGNRNFESTNVSIAKDALNKNFFTTDQIKEVLTFFTFESDKLDIAKYAYAHTCDQKNYSQLYDAFTFDSSVDELRNYISGK
jgi:hypothetical protein